MPEAAVTTEPHNEVIWVSVHAKKLDADSTEQLRQEVSKAPGSLPVVVDMSNVEFVPSLTLGALVALNKEMRQAGRRFILAGVQPLVRPVFAITRLDKLFEMHSTFDDAVGRVRDGR